MILARVLVWGKVEQSNNPKFRFDFELDYERQGKHV